MPLKNGHETPRERQFVELFARTGDRTYSAEKAGYRHPTIAAAQVLARPGVVEKVDARALAMLNDEVLPLAVARLKAIIEKPTTSDANALKAIDIALKHAGKDTASKGLADASAAELDTMIEVLRKRVADLSAPIIEHEPEAEGVFA